MSITWSEDGRCLQEIESMGWQLNVALFFSTISGEAEPDVIWQTVRPAPNSDIQLPNNYAINFTPQPPVPGMQVQCAGIWQPCQLGSSYTLENDGVWVQSQSASPGSIGVSQNDFGTVFVVIGTLDPSSGEFKPVFVDRSPLMPQTRAQYRPSNKTVLWLAGNTRGSEYVEGPGQSANVLDCSQGQTSWSTTYICETGTWQNSPNGP